MEQLEGQRLGSSGREEELGSGRGRRAAGQCRASGEPSLPGLPLQAPCWLPVFFLAKAAVPTEGRVPCLRKLRSCAQLPPSGLTPASVGCKGEKSSEGQGCNAYVLSWNLHEAASPSSIFSHKGMETRTLGLKC